MENHNWFESKRVKAAAESIDEIGLGMMWKIGRRPKGWNHFNVMGEPAETKISVLRLLDLGILFFATGGARSPTEHAYHWTSFGYEVMKHLGMTQLTIEEFKLMPEYKEAEELRKQFEESKKRFGNT